MLSIVPFGETNKVNNAFKCQNLFVVISNIQNVCLNGIMGKFFLEYLGDIIQYFILYFCLQNVFICYTANFLSFPDKNLWFLSQRRREGVVGDANGSVSK